MGSLTERSRRTILLPTCLIRRSIPTAFSRQCGLRTKLAKCKSTTSLCCKGGRIYDAHQPNTHHITHTTPHTHQLRVASRTSGYQNSQNFEEPADVMPRAPYPGKIQHWWNKSKTKARVGFDFVIYSFFALYMLSVFWRLDLFFSFSSSFLLLSKKGKV